MTMMVIKRFLTRPTSIMPLVVLRIGFGALMWLGTMRFMAKGWIYDFYVSPQFHFTYGGLGWIRPLSELGLWLVFVVMALCAICIVFGLFYRITMTTFFLAFTYIELLDKSYYLNHYYFVSVFAFILIFLPLNGAFALDNRLGVAPRLTHVPTWCVWLVRVQLGLVYMYAGIAKINADWLLEAQPLRIWLQARTGIGGIGWLFNFVWVAYVMSWAGMLFDLTIPVWLAWRRSRRWAYGAVVLFHGTTAVLFNIGIFPWVMIVCTLVFFEWQRGPIEAGRRMASLPRLQLAATVLSLLLLVQLLLPWRHWLYPGDVNWNEQGFRFSWRVMLVEKTGAAVFHVVNPVTEQSWVVLPDDYLTPIQVKQMAFQPDMIVQFAHFIEAQSAQDLIVTADVMVSWNGRSSRSLIQPHVDLTTVSTIATHQIVQPHPTEP